MDTEIDTEIDKILTQSTLLEVKHIDFGDMYEKEENDLELLRTLLKSNKDDKNVQAVIKLREDELKKMRELSYHWKSQVGISNHKTVRIAILIEEIK